MLEIANLSLLSQLQRASFARRTVCYIAASQVWTCPADGWLVLRCLGAGGSGASAYSPSACTGGSAGTVGLKRVRAVRGDQFTFTIPAGGASTASKQGNAGGTLTVTGPGVHISIPGGPGGRGAARVGESVQNDDAADPIGLDWFIKSARNSAQDNEYTGGAAPALLVGGQSRASTGVLGASVTGNTPHQTLMGAIGLGAGYAVPVPPMDASHCWLLIDVSGAWVSLNDARALAWRSGQGGSREGAPGGFGGGGAGRNGAEQNNVYSGAGGTGAGGGAMRAGPGVNQYGGGGGPGFVTLELLESQP